MYRCKLICGVCRKTIGYMSYPYKPVDDIYEISRVKCGDVVEFICCPMCEAEKMWADMTKEKEK